jgi:hypothetical protein
MQRNLDESTDRATRAGVVVNTLDARGVYANDSDRARFPAVVRFSNPRTMVQIAELRP